MSSHHFVKEGQEPALFISDPQSVNLNLLQQLLEWSPHVVISEACASSSIPLHIKIDAVAFSHSNSSAPNDLSFQHPFNTVRLTNGQITPLIDYLTLQGITALNVIHSVFDQEFIELLKPFVSKIDLVIYDQQHKSISIYNTVFEKWVTARTRFYLYGDVSSSKLLNLKKISKNCFVSEQTGPVSIASEAELFIVEQLSIR
ncbi:hypothetical protein AAG747_09755 [Rapidithrix thailandica]|uniref:Thiamine pyrophosphokinase n=1 Tax=Rapidithrix thailandica TaxID=413964 RepID=A0AAW9S737_9BACT